MKLSIVTINYNNAVGLKRTMESVLTQSNKNFEYIIIDGGSTDGSVEVIKSLYNKFIEKAISIYALSERDSGIYDAMNKGVLKAVGEYVLMLNSGDYLLNDDVVNAVLPVLDGSDIVQGNTIQNLSNGTYRLRGYGRSDISFIDAVEGNFLHQASFIKKSLHTRYGLYDKSYKKSGDTYFFISCLALGNASFKYVDIDIANYDANGISNSQNKKWVEIGRIEDAKWFGEHISDRMMKLVKEAPKCISLYESLHSNSVIWGLTKMLIKISHCIKPQQQYVKKELINE